MAYLTHLICTYCNRTVDHTHAHTLCSCGKVLFAKYDMEKVKETLTINSMSSRKNNIWRMDELMPCSSKYQFTLGEGNTPIIKLNDHHGVKVYVKDEGQNPTGSFKIRGLCAAVSRGIELGISEFVIPTAGNAGAALSAITAHTQTKAHIFMPQDTPQIIQNEVKAFGADIHLIDGLISDAGRIAKEEGEKNSWFNVSTLKEPYRVEGKKTMGFEVAEQFNWKLPDVIIYPTGGGTGIVGMAKAFDELEEIGLIDSQRPRMVSVQSSGCAPIVEAFDKKRKKAEFWKNAKTIAPGLRVPAAIGDYLILQAIYDTTGIAKAITDDEILSAMKTVAKREGIFMSSEAAATYAGLNKLISEGWIDTGESVVLFSTASGFTTPTLWD